MTLVRMIARGFRNLAPLDLTVPGKGIAFVGANGAGKTNLLEAIAYPVLWRSFRGANDADVASARGEGFRVEHDLGRMTLSATWRAGRKDVLVDGAPAARLADVIGRWLAVAFLPDDVRLASGPASERRLFLDRLLSLTDAGYLRALSQYRRALAQRNKALRGRNLEMASLFERPLAESGAALVRRRLAWVGTYAPAFRAELRALGEPTDTELAYRGDAALRDVQVWEERFRERRSRDEARGTTSVGPHRDDLTLLIGKHSIRERGSTGQQRSAAVALKLLELETIADARGARPALLLDDVFAELDDERRQRLGRRLFGGMDHQIFITAPRREDVPLELGVEIRTVQDGVVS